MQDDLYKNCCDTLEVSPDASMGEIKRSYLYLKELYSADSIASMALDNEFSESDKKKILAEIEQAFHTVDGSWSGRRGNCLVVQVTNPAMLLL